MNSSSIITWVFDDFMHSELISQSNKSSFSPEWLDEKIWIFYQKYYLLFVTFTKTTFFSIITQSRDSSSFVCFLHTHFSGYRNLNVHNFSSRQKFKKVNHNFFSQVLWLPVIKISNFFIQPLWRKRRFIWLRNQFRMHKLSQNSSNSERTVQNMISN